MTSANINCFVQVLNIAQSHAASAYNTLSAAATANWVGGPQASITGGFSLIGGEENAAYQSVAFGLQQIGTLMSPAVPSNAFSNASCFQRVLNADRTLGNLHLTFFDQPLTDPVTGKIYTIDSSLFSYILDNPVSPSNANTAFAELNPLDALLGQTANSALAELQNLNDVTTFLNIGTLALANIRCWTDCLQLPILLGTTATQTIRNQLNLSIETPLNVELFVPALLNAVPDIATIKDMTSLGTTMSSLPPLSNCDLVTAMTQPVSNQEYANLQASFGNGSGTFGNPTVDDILGATNHNETLSSTTQALQAIQSTTHYANISSDTAVLANAVNFGLTSNVTLSNGQTFGPGQINELAVAGSSLINNTAASLSTSSLLPSGSFSNFNQMALTHFNSATITGAAGSLTAPLPIPLQSIVGNSLATAQTLQGLAGIVTSLIHRLQGASSRNFSEFMPQPLTFWKMPGNMFSSINTFPGDLASLASLTSSMSAVPGISQLTGLSAIAGCINPRSLGGQALSATMQEAQSRQTMAQNGINNTNAINGALTSLTPTLTGSISAIAF